MIIQFSRHLLTFGLNGKSDYYKTSTKTLMMMMMMIMMMMIMMIIIIIIIITQLHFNICKEIGVKLDNKHW